MSFLIPDFLKDGELIPYFFYGTAWKEDKTAALTVQALQAGFRAIDTANQRRHYQWDKQVRDICTRQRILYQGFSLLTANAYELMLPVMAEIAFMHQKTMAQIIFRFCQQMGMIYLTGTSNLIHMQQDLKIDDFTLSEAELNLIENIGMNES